MARTRKTEDGAKSAANVFKAIDNKLKLPGGGCSEAVDAEVQVITGLLCKTNPMWMRH